MAHGALTQGQRLPPVRELAAHLGISPTTVSAAYRVLQQRGVITGSGRRGTFVAPRPALTGRSRLAVPSGVHDLLHGGPDPALLPDIGSALRRLPHRASSYGEPTRLPALVEITESQFAADCAPDPTVVFVSGGLDGVERTLAAHLLPGDKVAVEDPGYSAVHDLVAIMGLTAVPLAVDADGPVPEALEEALRAGARAAVVTPRAQNPTGALITEARRGELAAVLEDWPDTLVIEDDHAALIAGAPARTLSGSTRRWAIIRSVSKGLGPDLRVAFLAADELTRTRVESRQRAGAGWVSRLLQQIVADVLAEPSTIAVLAGAVAAYADRREAIVAALAARDIPALGASGLNVWVPVQHEQPVVAGLLDLGWAVSAGEQFRLRSDRGVRLSLGGFDVADAAALADAFAVVLGPSDGEARWG